MMTASINTTSTAFLDSLKGTYIYDPILEPNPLRFTLFPLQYQSLWESYKNAMTVVWFTEDVQIDTRDVGQLTHKEQCCILMIFECLLASNEVLLKDFVINLTNDIQIPEGRCFFGFQLTRDNIHLEIISLLISTFFTDLITLSVDGDGDDDDETTCMRLKKNWVIKHGDDDDNTEYQFALSFAKRLVITIIVKKLFQSGSFSLITAFKESNLLSASFSLAFDNIRKDYDRYNDYACLLYSSYLKNHLSHETLKNMINEAVCIEKHFVTNICSILGYNDDNNDDDDDDGGIQLDTHSICDYIEFTADSLIVALGYEEKLYNTPNPFKWMVNPTSSSPLQRKGIQQPISNNSGGGGDDIFTMDKDF
jgi:ribonucleotide reductase beta subunit family protein with ferritin-like domain